MRRVSLLLVAVLALAACSRDKGEKVPAGGFVPPPPLERAEFVKVSIDAECALLSDDGDLGDLDEYRETELKKIGKTPDDYFLAHKTYMGEEDVRREIEAKTATCWRKMGWVQKPGPDGQMQWERGDE